MQIDKHPFYIFLKHYWDEYSQLRENNLELDNATFHKKFGISLTVPNSWPIIHSIGVLLGEMDKKQVVIIFPSTQMYKTLYDRIGDGPEYCTWSEIYTAIHLAGHDVRSWQHIRQSLNDAKLVIFVGSSSAAGEVVDQVRVHVNGCLILLG